MIIIIKIKIISGCDSTEPSNAYHYELAIGTVTPELFANICDMVFVDRRLKCVISLKEISNINDHVRIRKTSTS